MQSPIRIRDGWFKGELKRFRWFVTDKNDGTGTPIDVSAFALRWVVEDPRDFSCKIVKVYPGPDVQVEDGNGTNDSIIVSVHPDDARELEAGKHRYGLWRTDGDDDQLLAYGDAFLQEAAK